MHRLQEGPLLLLPEGWKNGETAQFYYAVTKEADMFIESIEGILLFYLATVINIALTIYIWIIIIRVIASWIMYLNPYGSIAKFLSPYNPNPLVQFLYRTTEPVLWRVRRLLPFRNIGIDFSPLIVILIIYLLQIIVVRSLYQLAVRLG